MKLTFVQPDGFRALEIDGVGTYPNLVETFKLIWNPLAITKLGSVDLV